MKLKQFKEASNLYTKYLDLKAAIEEEKKFIKTNKWFNLPCSMVYLEKEELEAIIEVQKSKMEKIKQRLIELGFEFEEEKEVE